MDISSVVAQLRTTDLAASIRFYTALPGFTLAFQHEDFYAGIRAGTHLFHLKLVDAKDPSIDVVARDDHLHLRGDRTGACLIPAGRLLSLPSNAMMRDRDPSPDSIGDSRRTRPS